MTPIRDSKLRYLALAVVLALAAGTVASAQSWAGKGRIQGKVRGPDGQPLEGVKVTLMMNGVEGQGPEPLLTDKKGHWSYLGLTGGNFSVVLEYEGLMTSEGSVRVSEFGAGPNVKIQMKEIPRDLVQEAADERRGLLNQGNAYLEQGKFAAARTAYEEVLQTVPEESQPAILRAIGSTHQGEGHFAEARALYEKALELAGGEDSSLLHDIARTWYEEKNTDQAVATLDKALEIAPGDETTLRLIVDILVASGRETDAQPYIRQLPQGSKMDANTLLNMGINLVNQDDPGGALEFFNRAVEENPELADAYYYRGLSYLQTGKNEEAKADFGKLLELAPGYAKADEVKQFIEYLDSQE